MNSKNRSFMSDLASSVDQATEPTERSARRGVGILGGRSNRLAEIASGAAVDNPQEFVHPARCRIWERHNRDYTALNYDRCRDLVDSILAQGKQEVPAIVRRVSDDPHYDYEVICGARRHWSVQWLQQNNHPEIRYLIEVRTLTDEQAFRISDLENRAREDLTDLERARDYLKALSLYYNGRQKDMAKRINQSEAWLSRYLDLARLPSELVDAFPDPYELKISHIGALKPILKADAMRAAVLAEACRIREQRDEGVAGGPTNAPEMIRRLVTAAERAGRPGEPVKARSAPKRSGMGSGTIFDDAGAPLLRVDGKDRRALTLTLFHKGGGDRAAAEAAFSNLLDRYWPKPS